MIGNLFHTVFYEPLYNALVLIIDILPSQDVGIAIIILTLLVSLLILPITLKATRTQIKMKLIEPKLKEIQEKYKDNREEQARQMMTLYREEKINPFSGILLLLVQLPFVIALYYVFARGGLPVIDPEELYSFIPTPSDVNVMFLGLVNITEKSLVLAFIAAVAQFIQSHILLSTQVKTKKEESKSEKKQEKKEPSFQEELAKGMSFQMRFALPVLIGFISYSLTGVVALYFIARSVFTVIQEVSVKRKIRESYESAK